jgi:hypothetical protein
MFASTVQLPRYGRTAFLKSSRIYISIEFR